MATPAQPDPQDALNPHGAGSGWPHPVFWPALALQLVAGIYHLAVGLVAPVWMTPIMVVIWAAWTTVLVRNRKRPLISLAIPFATMAAWALIVQTGSWLFGWTA